MLRTGLPAKESGEKSTVYSAVLFCVSGMPRAKAIDKAARRYYHKKVTKTGDFLQFIRLFIDKNAQF